jgi:hypothetical protein
MFEALEARFIEPGLNDHAALVSSVLDQDATSPSKVDFAHTRATANDEAGWLWESTSGALTGGSKALAPPVEIDEALDLLEILPGLASLPDSPHVLVNGSISSNDPVDFFQIPIQPGAETIVLTLERPFGPILTGLVDRFMLFDDSGAMVKGRDLDDGAAAVQVTVRLPEDGSGATQGMFVGIGRPMNHASAIALRSATHLVDILAALESWTESEAPPIDGLPAGEPGTVAVDGEPMAQNSSPYTLSVQQLPETTGSEGTPSSAGDATTVASVFVPTTAMTVALLPSRHGGGAAVVESGSSIGSSRYETRIQTVSVEVRPRPASRPVPLRAAEPAGGVLAREKSEDGVDLVDGTMYDLDLLVLLMARDGKFVDDELAAEFDAPGEPQGAGGGEGAGAPLATAMGMPLVGADWPPVQLASAEDARSRPRSDDGADGVRASAKPPLDLIDRPLQLDAAPIPASPRQDQNPAITCGLGVAYALAITCLLPDVKTLLRSSARRARPLLRRLGLVRIDAGKQGRASPGVPSLSRSPRA